MPGLGVADNNHEILLAKGAFNLDLLLIIAVDNPAAAFQVSQVNSVNTITVGATTFDGREHGIHLSRGIA